MSHGFAVPLPRDMLFLGEVYYSGKLCHPYTVSRHYLDFFIEQGYRKVVGPVNKLSELQAIMDADVNYQGKVELIGIDNALDLVSRVLKDLIGPEGRRGGGSFLGFVVSEVMRGVHTLFG